jgi:hypothetical protein
MIIKLKLLGMGWIQTAQNREQWWTTLNMVVNLLVLLREECLD